jgi:adenine phosphoribosyltransferase
LERIFIGEINMLENIKKSLLEAPVIKKRDYDYFVHPITDGIPLVTAEIMEEVAEAIAQHADTNVDKIVCVEAMGIHITTALSIKTRLPFVVVRKRQYGLEGEVDVHQVTGYSHGNLYINGLKKGERVMLVDDVVSTGGTMTAVLNALKALEVDVVDVLAVMEKGKGKEVVEESTGFKVKTLLKVNVKDGKVEIED